MKIIKHTFEIPVLTVENGELVEKEPHYQTCTFTLLHGGIGRFEENSNEPLLSKLNKLTTGADQEKSMSILSDREFVLNLACASYVKIEGNKFENNRATYEEFKNSEVANYIYDVEFITKLIQMVTDCVLGQMSKKKTESTGKNK